MGGCDRGRGRQTNVDGDRLYYTHCEKSRHTCETCWDLVGKPGHFRNAIASPTESNRWGANSSYQGQVMGKDESQNLKEELMILRERLHTLGGNSSSSVGMVLWLPLISVILLLWLLPHLLPPE